MTSFRNAIRAPTPVLAVWISWGLRFVLFGLVVATADPFRAGHAKEALNIKTPAGHVVRFDASCESDAKRIAAALPGIQKNVEQRLITPFRGGPATIVVVDSVERIRALVGSSVPTWAAGVCVGARALIVIRSDVAHNGAPYRTLQTVMRHEWVHLALYRMTGPGARLPRWFEEGLCESIGGGLSVDGGATLEVAASTNHLLSFDNLVDRWPRGATEAALAYRQGRSWVDYLSREEGPFAVARIVKSVAREPTSMSAEDRLDRAVHEVTGIRVDLWTARWQERLKETSRFWYHLLFRDITQTIFLLLGLLSVGWFFVMRARRRKAYAQLVLEEAGGSEDDDFTALPPEARGDGSP